MNPVEKFKEMQAERVIKCFERRNMEGYYAKTKEEALQIALSIIPEKCKVTWGGGESLIEIGLIDALKNGDYKALDRKEVPAEKIYDFYIDVLKTDFFLTSANAVTEDGLLVNIDGRGNRINAISFGPRNILAVVSMNKIAKDLDAAIYRARNYAAPMNATRLSKKTPCHEKGKCFDCNSPDCICSNIMITRNSIIKNRIKIILVGEDLGF